MKVIRVSSDGRYTHHGIGYTEHDGYSGTADNRWSLRMAVLTEYARGIRPGEEFCVELNGVVQTSAQTFKRFGVESPKPLNLFALPCAACGMPFVPKTEAERFCSVDCQQAKLF